MTGPSPSPPITPSTFRVGVSGHRPNRLRHSDPKLLGEQIGRVLEAIRDQVTVCSAGLPATLRVLSSLAEGTDRLVATQAIEHGYRLQVPLPFPRDDYEADFETAESKEEFRTLLARADAIFEMDAPTGERALGYRAAGEIVLNQCDLFLVVWDGQPAAGIGGTPELIEHAVSFGRPVLRIDAAAPHPITALWATGQDPFTGVSALVHSVLTLPAVAQPFAEGYAQEAWPRRNASTAYGFLRVVSKGRWKFAPHRSWNDPVLEITLPLLKSYFHWADALASHYGERSRSAALRLQLLALGAVVSGLLTIPFEEHLAIVRVLSSLELGATLLLVLQSLVVSRKPWHKRWLLYRSLAEQLRSLDLLATLGQSLAQPASTQSDHEEDGSTAFGLFHLNGIVRHLGLPQARVDSPFLASRRAALAAVLADQAAFQKGASERYEAAGKTLHRLGLALFSAAAALSLYDVAKAFGLTGFASPWTTTASALLPAIGSAFASIAAQGEYERLAHRARGMARTLNSLLSSIQSQAPPTLSALTSISMTAAEVLTSEVRDWQVLVSIKKPSLPV